MERFFLRSVALIALLAVTSVVFSGCDKNPEDTNSNDLFISGEFASQTGSGKAMFYANITSTSLVGSEKVLVGKIMDSDVTFDIKGVYDESSKEYHLSAGSGSLIYSLAGSVQSGDTTGEAYVKINNSNVWSTNTTPASITNSTASVSTAVTRSITQKPGVPTSWYGTWEDKAEGGSYVMTDYQMIDLDFPDLPSGYLDVVPLGNGKYEMVWESWVFEEDSTGNLEIYISYFKLVGELTNAGLVLKVYGGEHETFAEAQAQSLTGDDPYILTLTRP